MNPTQLTTTLQSAGGWGLSAVLMLAILFLVRYVQRLVEDRNNREKEQNQKLLDLLEKRIETDVKHEQAFNNLARSVEMFTAKL
jgi:hypothetical protein